MIAFLCDGHESHKITGFQGGPEHCIKCTITLNDVKMSKRYKTCTTGSYSYYATS